MIRGELPAPQAKEGRFRAWLRRRVEVRMIKRHQRKVDDRARVLMLLQHGPTAKQIAASLDIPHASIYPLLLELERRSLIGHRRTASGGYFYHVLPPASRSETDDNVAG